MLPRSRLVYTVAHNHSQLSLHICSLILLLTVSSLSSGKLQNIQLDTLIFLAD